jgi:hypothetical protein
MFKEDKLAAMQVSAQSEVETAARARWPRIMSAENMEVCAQELLFRSAVGHGVGDPAQGLILQPKTPTAQHRFTNVSEPDPPVVISANGTDWSHTAHAFNQTFQRRYAQPPVHQISTEQNNVRLFPGNDIENAVNHVSRSILLEVKIAGKKDALAEGRVRDSLTTHLKRPVRTNLKSL